MSTKMIMIDVTILVMMDKLFFVWSMLMSMMATCIHIESRKESDIFVHTVNKKFKDISAHRFETKGLRHEKIRDAPVVKKSLKNISVEIFGARGLRCERDGGMRQSELDRR